MGSKGAFPNMLGGFYRLDASTEVFIPGVDGAPEFASLDQKWRAVEPIDASDVESVIVDGVILPAVVRKRKDGRAEVIDGRQRARWVRAANAKILAADPNAIPIPLPVRLEDAKASEARAFGRTMSTNYHRVDVSPMQASEDAIRMLQLLGESDLENVSTSSLRDVASRMRSSTATVKSLIALGRLDERVQALVASRVLPKVFALTLVDLDAEEQVQRADAAVASGSSAASLIDAANLRDVVGEGTGEIVDEVEQPTRKPREAKDEAKRKPLSIRQVRGALRLILEDKAAGAGAGVDISDDVVKALRIVVGDVGPSALSGVTNILNRLAKGE